MADFDTSKFEVREWLDEIERLVRLILFKIEEARWVENKNDFQPKESRIRG